MKLRTVIPLALTMLLLLVGTAMQQARDSTLAPPRPVLQPAPLADTTPPTTTLTRSGPSASQDSILWVSPATTHTLTAQDDTDPPEALTTFYRAYAVAGELQPAFQQYTAPFQLTGTDGRYRIEFYSRDTAGNTEAVRRVTEHLDSTPPQTSWTVGTPVYPDELDRTWITSDTALTLRGTDPAAPDGTPGAGVETIFFRVYQPGAVTDFMPYNAPFVVAGADGEYTLDFFASDRVGNVSNTQSASIFLDNTPPEADAGGPYRSPEGAEITFDATASRDAGVGIADFAWDLDGDGNFTDASGPTVTRRYPDDLLFEVAVQVTDHLGHSAIDRADAVVENVPPSVQIASVRPEQPWPFQTVTLEALFVDPGWLDTHTATVDWGDGITTTAEISETNGPPQARGIAHATHRFATPGIYPVTITVTDDDGGSGSASTEIVVELSPQMPGVFVPGNESLFHAWTGGFPDTLGNLRRQWRNGVGITDYWWIYEGQGWLFFFQKTPADWPQFHPNLPADPYLNRLAVAVPRETFQKWFWCGVAWQNPGFTHQGCHPLWGPPPEGAGELHPWVQQRIEESRQHVLNILANTFSEIIH